MIYKKITYLQLMIFFIFNANVFADTTLVAVASNFTKPMTEIAAEFEKATGHTAQSDAGKTG